MWRRSHPMPGSTNRFGGVDGRRRLPPPGSGFDQFRQHRRGDRQFVAPHGLALRPPSRCTEVPAPDGSCHRAVVPLPSSSARPVPGKPPRKAVPRTGSRSSCAGGTGPRRQLFLTPQEALGCGSTETRLGRAGSRRPRGKKPSRGRRQRAPRVRSAAYGHTDSIRTPVTFSAVASSSPVKARPRQGRLPDTGLAGDPGAPPRPAGRGRPRVRAGDPLLARARSSWDSGNRLVANQAVTRHAVFLK